jgi:hypothetical protein
MAKEKNRIRRLVLGASSITALAMVGCQAETTDPQPVVRVSTTDIHPRTDNSGPDCLCYTIQNDGTCGGGLGVSDAPPDNNGSCASSEGTKVGDGCNCFAGYGQ